MAGIVLAVNPLLASMGQIAVLVICLFALIFIVVSVALNLVMSFVMSWLNEKAELIKMLRPYVESVNTTSKAAERGIAPAEDKPAPVRIVGQLPLSVNEAEKKVEQVSDRVTNVVIEFRARTIQAKTIAKAFFLPGLMDRKSRGESLVNEAGQQFGSPGYRALMNEHPEVIPGQESRREAPLQQQAMRQQR
ncbi:hypothetical protein [Dictyobacter formicarum]|uniref:Uncharacterized protein n=1 Tax=Dictyobacter formicarum TaxID=2778368 RepID=A0ABQ3VPG6_9CHLR|nr:hypothetical protein [Dictyobacter formicarum]GHO87718.1 hypothetical protein KSZ_57240 [Dictyobacter formicarum]